MDPGPIFTGNPFEAVKNGRAELAPSALAEHNGEHSPDPLVRIEAKLDRFGALLDRFLPLLELAERRAKRGGRWMRGSDGHEG